MPLEDFTTFVEVDPNNHITVANPTHVDFNCWRDEDAYLYKDYGVGHFVNFEHLIDIKLVASDNLGRWNIWCVANNIDDIAGANFTGFYAFMYRFNGTYYIYLRERLNGVVFGSDNWNAAAVGTWYYLKIRKAGLAFTCEIYTDAARTVLADTLTIVLQAGPPAMRYCYAAITINTGNAWDADGDVENLDLQELPAGAGAGGLNPTAAVKVLLDLD